MLTKYVGEVTGTSASRPNSTVRELTKSVREVTSGVGELVGGEVTGCPSSMPFHTLISLNVQSNAYSLLLSSLS